jgi:hypothetical protein
VNGFVAAVGAALLAASPSAAALTFTARSEPQGVLAQVDSLPVSGTTLTTPVAADRPDLGLLFTHWSLTPASQAAACATGRCIDASGQALTRVRFTITADTVAIAHYVGATVDDDADGIADARELRYFGDLSRTGDDDGDGDGIALRDELARGLNPRLVDVALAGAPTRGSAAPLRLVTRDGLAFFHEHSIPAGIVAREQVTTLGSRVWTSVPPAHAGSLGFGWWLIEGEVQRDAAGLPLLRPSWVVTTETTATATYLDRAADSDADGIPDWLEYRWFGALDRGADDDPDGDGFTIADELARGMSPRLFERQLDGGLTSSPVAMLRLSLVPGWLLTIGSNPTGIVASSTGAREAGAAVTTPPAPLQFGSLHFVCWRRDGLPLRDVAGACIPGAIALTMPPADLDLSAGYLGLVVDSDGDGLPDWFEIAFAPSEAMAPTDDADGDGVSAIDEFHRGRSVLLADTLRPGGITASALGPKFGFRVFSNGFELRP